MRRTRRSSPRGERGAAPRIAGGTCGGMILFSPEGAELRPAQAIVRKSLFDILAPLLADARCLDLFAGTGAVGIEALSRGAATCLFVDRDPRCAEAIERNLQKTRLADRAMVLTQDVLAWPGLPPRDPGRYDLVFVDPPYRLWEDPAMDRLIDFLGGSGMLAPEARVICEHPSRRDVGPASGSLRAVDRRTYGQTALTFLAPV